MVSVLPHLKFVNWALIVATARILFIFSLLLNRAISINRGNFHTLVMMTFKEIDIGSIELISSPLNPDVAIRGDFCVHVNIFIGFTTEYLSTGQFDLDIKALIKSESSCITFTTITFSASNCLHNF